VGRAADDDLLAAHRDVVVSGTVSNQGGFGFDHVVLLSAPPAVLLERLRTRTTNPYGATPEQRAEVLGYVETVEPLLRRACLVELDGRRPVVELADAVEELVRGPLSGDRPGRAR
jgi:broad-specificity NMP kinase